MGTVLILAALLCDPCSRAYPVGCQGDCKALSNTPVISCATFPKWDFWERGVKGVRLLWRAADETTWSYSDPIPLREYLLDGKRYAIVPGLTLTGKQHPDDPRIYRTPTLPLHRYLDLPPGELVHVTVVPYNAAGLAETTEPACPADGSCGGESCGYVEICWYPIWEFPGPEPAVECW